MKHDTLMSDFKELKESVDRLLSDLGDAADTTAAKLREALTFKKGKLEVRAKELAEAGDAASSELAKGFENALDDLRDAASEARAQFDKK